MTGMGYLSPPFYGERQMNIYIMNTNNDKSFVSPTIKASKGNSYTVTDYIVVIDKDRVHYPVETVTHEMFHTIHIAYDPMEAWFAEATANWMVYRWTNNLYYLSVVTSDFLNNPQLPLDTPESVSPGHCYGAWIFCQFISERLNEEMVLSFWENCADLAFMESGIEAIKETLKFSSLPDADFRNLFRDFWTWNYMCNEFRCEAPNNRYKAACEMPEFEGSSIERDFNFNAGDNKYYFPSRDANGELVSETIAIPKLSAKVIRIGKPLSLEKNRELIFNFQKGKGKPSNYKVSLVGWPSTYDPNDILMLDYDNGGSFQIVQSIGYDPLNTQPSHYESIAIIVTNNSSTDYTFEYSGMIAPGFVDAYAAETRSTGITDTVYNFDPSNEYTEGDSINLEVTTHTEVLEICADFSAIDSTYSSGQEVIGAPYINVDMTAAYSIFFPLSSNIDDLSSGNIYIKAISLDKSGKQQKIYDEDSSFNAIIKDPDDPICEDGSGFTGTWYSGNPTMRLVLSGEGTISGTMELLDLYFWEMYPCYEYDISGSAVKIDDSSYYNVSMTITSTDNPDSDVSCCSTYYLNGVVFGPSLCNDVMGGLTLSGEGNCGMPTETTPIFSRQD